MSEIEATAAATETTATEQTAITEPTTSVSTEATTGTKFTNEQIFEMFKGSLSDDLKGHSYIGKYKNAEDFAKAGINHQSSLTKKASEYFESDEPAVVAERNKLMGVPENAEGYELTPELVEQISPESMEAFRAKALEIGLPQKYINDLVQFEADLWTKNAENLQQEAVDQKDSATKALQEVWKGDQFDHNERMVSNLLKSELGLSAEDMAIPLGNNVNLIKALHERVVPLFGEDKLIEGTMSQTNVSASQRMSELNGAMFKTDRGTPEYKALMTEKMALMSRMK